MIKPISLNLLQFVLSDAQETSDLSDRDQPQLPCPRHQLFLPFRSRRSEQAPRALVGELVSEERNEDTPGQAPDWLLFLQGQQAIPVLRGTSREVT